MTKNVNIELSDEEFAKLGLFKEEHGLTWKGVLKYGTFQEKSIGDDERFEEAER